MVKKNTLSAILFFALVSTQAQVRSLGTDAIKDSSHYKNRLKIFKNEPVLKTNVLMLGDDFIESANWKKLLNDVTVLNRGISGDNTSSLMNRLDEVTRHRPNKIYLLIGLNDFLNQQSVEFALENMFTLISKLHAKLPKTKIYVQSVLPVNETLQNFPAKYQGVSPKIATINQQLSKYGERLNYVFIDLYKVFVDQSGNLKPLYTNDGIHLTDLGYQHWVKNILHSKVEKTQSNER